jgi:iron complex transport system substrate-binding protein
MRAFASLLLLALCCMCDATASELLPSRIVALNRESTETLLALGVVPLGVAEIDGYRRWVGSPPIPQGVVDVGLRAQPNLELLQHLAPDLILTTQGFEADRRLLERIAPTLSLSIYTQEGQPYRRAREETIRIARALGREEAAEVLLAGAEKAFDDARAKLCPDRQRPLYVIIFLDQRHVMVFGAKSLFQDVLARLGLHNAWSEQTNFWGFATVGIERLAGDREAQIVHVGPVDVAEKTLAESPLWRSLPMVRAGRFTVIPSVWMFGAVPAAERFATLLGQGLARTDCMHG